MSNVTLPRRTTIALSIALALAACGGGGGSSSPPSAPPAPTITLSGVVADGYLDGSTVSLILAGGTGPTVTTKSGPGGQYTLQTNLTAAELLNSHLVVTGGTDTSTNTPFTGSMTALVSDATQAVIPIDPFTTLISAMVSSGAASSAAQAEADLATVFGLSSAAVLTQDPLSLVTQQPSLLQNMVALQQALDMLALADTSSTVNGSAGMNSAATAIGAVIAQQAAAITAQTNANPNQAPTLPTIGALVTSAVATQPQAFTNLAAVQATAPLAAQLANVTEVTVAVSVSQILQANPNAATLSGSALAAAETTLNANLSAIAPLQTAALAVAAQNAAASPAALASAIANPVTLASVAANLSPPASAALLALVDATQNSSTIPSASATPSAGLNTLTSLVAALTATPTLTTVSLTTLNGTISSPATFDASSGSGRFSFTDNIAVSSFTSITNFGVNDSIAITGGGSNDLLVSNKGADVVFTVNAGGVVTQITLVGVTTPSAVIGSLAEFNALNAGSVTYQ